MSTQNSIESLSVSKSEPNFVQDCPPGYQWDIKLRKCVLVPIDISYAGVIITYYSDSHLLSFKDTNDVNTVLNQLDADYENCNTTYENQYPNYTDLQLDSLDSVNNFDQLQSYKNFEAKFSGYISMRRIFENNETAWLNNDMNGADPDSLDYTVDNSENASCNNNYQLIIAGTTYQWTSSGFIAGGGSQSLNQYSPASGGLCFTNYRLKKPFYSTDNTRRCQLKVAVNDCLIRSSGKAKVKSFRKKSNGKWIRSRLNIQVDIIGSTFYLASGCVPWYNPTASKGPKKRVELKAIDRQASGAAHTESGKFQGNFSSNVSGLTGTLFLQ